jgi:integrase
MMKQHELVENHKAAIRSLPIDLWPKADRSAWESACRPPHRLKRGGGAGHLKPITRDDLARRYGYFLDFLSRRNSLPMDGPAAGHVTSSNVDDYLTEIKQRVSSVTVYGSIYKLRRTSQIIAPTLDFAWLTEMEKDLALSVRPQSKFNRLVLAEILVEAGLSLIAEADASTSMTGLRQARAFRNGLMVALLALCPIRLKNYAALDIGRTFVDIKRKWWIVLPALETKEGRADERPVDDMLKPAIERYLATFRLVLEERGSPSSALWLSGNDGMPMSYSQVERAITAATLATVGVGVTPHLFRTSAASTAATRAGDNPHLGSALLHHINRGVTNRHYNRALSLSAVVSLYEVMQKFNRDEM